MVRNLSRATLAASILAASLLAGTGSVADAAMRPDEGTGGTATNTGNETAFDPTRTTRVEVVIVNQDPYTNIITKETTTVEVIDNGKPPTVKPPWSSTIRTGGTEVSSVCTIEGMVAKDETTCNGWIIREMDMSSYSGGAATSSCIFYTMPNFGELSGGSSGFSYQICPPGVTETKDPGALAKFGVNGIDVCVKTWYIERIPGTTITDEPVGCSGFNNAAVKEVCDSGATQVRVGFTLRLMGTPTQYVWMEPPPVFDSTTIYWGPPARSVMNCAREESEPPTAVRWNVDGDIPRAWSGDGTPLLVKLRATAVGGGMARLTFLGFSTLGASNYPRDYYELRPAGGATFNARFFYPSDSLKAPNTRGPYGVSARGSYYVEWWKNLQTVSVNYSCGSDAKLVATQQVIGYYWVQEDSLVEAEGVLPAFVYRTNAQGSPGAGWTKAAPRYGPVDVSFAYVRTDMCSTATTSTVTSEPGTPVVRTAQIDLPLEAVRPQITN